MKTAKPLLILLITCLIGLILARLIAIHVRQHLLLIAPKIKMKTILTILLALTVFASNAQKHKHAKVPDSLMQFNPTNHKLKCTSCAIQVKRYFDYTTKFTTTDSCNGSSHGTNSWLHSASPTFDDIKYLTAKWIYPKKLQTFSVLSIKEIQATDTLKWGDVFKCMEPIQTINLSKVKIYTFNGVLENQSKRPFAYTATGRGWSQHSGFDDTIILLSPKDNIVIKFEY